MYAKPTEENALGKEQSELGKEITTLQPAPPKQKSSDNKTKSFVDKVFNTIKGATTVTAVAAGTVVGATTLLSAPPKIELLEFTCGDTYVEYEISLDDLQADLTYFLIIRGDNTEDVKIEVDDGVYENRVDGLLPDWDYTFQLVGDDIYLGQTTYFEKVFRTEATKAPALDFK